MTVAVPFTGNGASGYHSGRVSFCQGLALAAAKAEGWRQLPSDMLVGFCVSAQHHHHQKKPIFACAALTLGLGDRSVYLVAPGSSISAEPVPIAYGFACPVAQVARRSAETTTALGADLGA